MDIANKWADLSSISDSREDEEASSFEDSVDATIRKALESGQDDRSNIYQDKTIIAPGRSKKTKWEVLAADIWKEGTKPET